MTGTTDFKRLEFSYVCEELTHPKNTLILFHVRPDGDAVGSAFGLRILLEALGSRAWCMCANEVPQRLSFLKEDIQTSALPEALPSDFQMERIIAVDTASASQLGDLYSRFAGKIDIEIDHHSMGEPYADYSLTLEERVQTVKNYYESKYSDASERFTAFKADTTAPSYLGEYYSAVYDYFSQGA